MGFDAFFFPSEKVEGIDIMIPRPIKALPHQMTLTRGLVETCKVNMAGGLFKLFSALKREL
jgi:hypothetical protein